MVPSENILNFYICKNFACITEFLETMSFKLKPQGCNKELMTRDPWVSKKTQTLVIIWVVY